MRTSPKHALVAGLTALLTILFFQLTPVYAQTYKGFSVGQYQGQAYNKTGGSTGKATLEICRIGTDGAVQAYLRDSDGLEGAGTLTGSINTNGVMQLTGVMTSPSNGSRWQSALIAVVQNGQLRMGNKLTLGNTVEEETATMVYANPTTPAPVNTTQPVQALTGVGAEYGARNPRTCVDKTIPQKGAPTAAQVVQQFICQTEGIHTGAASGTQILHLVDNVRVQVAPPRPFRPNVDLIDDIRPGEPIYQIRGSYTKYNCDVIRADQANAGKNCQVYVHQNATGLCYRNTFGDWYCYMSDFNHPVFPDQYDAAPPR